jgi:uncharacterized membrane protein (DUF373 family)
MEELLRHYHFGPTDERNLVRLGEVLLPEAGSLAEAFYDYLAEDPYTAAFFPNEEAVQRRKQTFRGWFDALLTERLDDRYLRRLQKIGKVHVRINLPGHYVNAAVNFVRGQCREMLEGRVPDSPERQSLQDTWDKVLDINLDVMTSSYREEELRKFFLSQRVESALIRWTERLTFGLNLLLVLGLLAMAVAITALFGYDVVQAFTVRLDVGVIQALGSLLILWMMIELLHAEVRYLKGGQFSLRVFLELALVAFIRKLFIAALEKTDPLTFGLLLASLLVLGALFFLITRSEERGAA